MPPKLDWPSESELRAVFQRYDEQGLVDRDGRIDKFLEEYPKLKASRRSVLDLIRSLESGNGRVLETIRSRDEREKQAEATDREPGPSSPSRASRPREIKSSPLQNILASSSSPLVAGPVKRRPGRPPKNPRPPPPPAESSGSSSEREESSSPSPDPAMRKRKAGRPRGSTNSKKIKSEESPAKPSNHSQDAAAVEIKRLEGLLRAAEEESESLKTRYQKDHKSWSENALALEQETEMLSESVDNMREKLRDEKSKTDRLDAELGRVLKDLEQTKAKLNTKEKQVESLQQETQEALIERERYKTESETLHEVVQTFRPSAPPAPASVPLLNNITSLPAPPRLGRFSGS